MGRYSDVFRRRCRGRQFEPPGIPALLDPAIELCRTHGSFVWQGNYGAAPVSLAGSVVQHAAESLAGIVIHQAAAPGAPIVWGGAPAILDMRTGATPMGAIETAMLNAGNAQVGRSLGLPTHGYLGASDAKLVDAQAGMESATTALVGTLAGIDLISGIGMLDELRCQSVEKLVIDAEAVSSALRLVRGIDAPAEGLGLAAIRAAGFAGRFLEQPETRRRFRAEQHIPSRVVERGSLGAWREAGSRDAFAKAREEVQVALRREGIIARVFAGRRAPRPQVGAHEIEHPGAHGETRGGGQRSEVGPPDPRVIELVRQQLADRRLRQRPRRRLQAGLEDRAREGIFLAFQYPVEIPGVSNMYFLKAALNAVRRHRHVPELDAMEFLKLIKEKRKLLKIDEEMMRRSLNVGFSGGEKKRNEVLQMALLEPTLAVLDETDSGLDIDALKIVADGVNALRGPERAILMITHYQRLLDYVVPDFVHVLAGGRIVRSGGKELALQLEKEGYGDLAVRRGAA